MMKYYFHILFICLSVQLSAQSDTLRVYFSTDDPFLNAKASKVLQANFSKLDTAKDILIIGYADERGDTYYNDMLSMRRAQSVARFFEDKGIPTSHIKLVYGKGKVNRTDGNEKVYNSDRRVDVVTAKLASAPPSATFRWNDSLGMPALEQMINRASVNSTITLENINFYLGSVKVTPTSLPTMQELLRVMKARPTLKIKLEGHICCIDLTDPRQIVGGKTLSSGRAETIAQFLIENGIDASRLQTEGFGKTRPLFPIERTEKERAANRRVEIRITAK